MPVGTQKDYYATLGVERSSKPEQLRKVMIMLLKNQRNLEKKEGNGNE